MKRIRDYSRQHACTRLFSFVFAAVFSLTMITPPGYVLAQTPLNLPVPGTMITASPGYTPTLIRGITIHPDNPLMFDFIIDSGDSQLKGEALKAESMKLMKYFFASLTVPEKELWVNLSPYEGNRIIPKTFGITDAGISLLAEDYMLKQLAASMIYPEEKMGKDFWKRVYKKAEVQFGEPVATFNKIWIVPDEAMVLEKDNTAYVIKSHLKVMLEEDYFAMNSQKAIDKKNGKAEDQGGLTDDMKAQTEALKEVVLPAIEKEVNEGENFAQLRQVYNAVILASWYKNNLKDSLLGQVYVDQNKVAGVDTSDPAVKEAIYKQYVKAYEKGVYSYIKEEYDQQKGRYVPRKYFAGGVALRNIDSLVSKQIVKATDAAMLQSSKIQKVIHDVQTRMNQDINEAFRSAGIPMTATGTPLNDRDVQRLRNTSKINVVTGSLVGMDKTAARIVSNTLQGPASVYNSTKTSGPVARVLDNAQKRRSEVYATISDVIAPENVGNFSVPDAAKALNINFNLLYSGDIEKQGFQPIRNRNGEAVSFKVAGERGSSYDASLYARNVSEGLSVLNLGVRVKGIDELPTTEADAIRNQTILARSLAPATENLGLNSDFVIARNVVGAIAARQGLDSHINHLPDTLRKQAEMVAVVADIGETARIAAIPARTFEAVDIKVPSEAVLEENGTRILDLGRLLRGSNVIDVDQLTQGVDVAMVTDRRVVSQDVMDRKIEEAIQRSGGNIRAAAAGSKIAAARQEIKAEESVRSALVDEGGMNNDFAGRTDIPIVEIPLWALVPAGTEMSSITPERAADIGEKIKGIASQAVSGEAPGANFVVTAPAAMGQEAVDSLRKSLSVPNAAVLREEEVRSIAPALDIISRLSDSPPSPASLIAEANGALPVVVATTSGPDIASRVSAVSAQINSALGRLSTPESSASAVQDAIAGYRENVAARTNDLNTVRVIKAVEEAVPEAQNQGSIKNDDIVPAVNAANVLTSNQVRLADANRRAASAETPELKQEAQREVAEIKADISSAEQDLRQAYIALGVPESRVDTYASSARFKPLQESFAGTQASDLGGIDLNPELLDMVVKRDGNGVPLPVSDQPMEELKNIQGFLPVITNVSPMQSLPSFK